MYLVIGTIVGVVAFIAIIYLILTLIMKKGKKKLSVTARIFISVSISVFLAISVVFIISGKDDSSKSTENIIETKMDYKVIKTWKLPNGGKGCVILVDSTNLTEEEMEQFGKQLKYEYRNEKNAFIWIYDKIEAANLFDKVQRDMNLTKEESTLYDSHFIGTYTKNGNSGRNRFSCFLEGLNGPVQIYDY